MTTGYSADIGINIVSEIVDKGQVSLSQYKQNLKEINAEIKKSTSYSQLAQGVMEKEYQTKSRSNAILKEMVVDEKGWVKEIAHEKVVRNQLEGELEANYRAEQRLWQESMKTGESYDEVNARIGERVRAQSRLEVSNEQAMKSNRALRWSIMQASISLFVLNISIHQVIKSITYFIGENEEAERTMKDLGAVIQMAISPFQVYYAMLQITQQKQSAFTYSLYGTMSAMVATLLIYKAMNAESRQLRAIYSALAAVLVVLALRNYANAIAKMWSAYGTWSAKTAQAMGPWALPVIIGGAAVFAGLIGAMSYPRGQTAVGEERIIRKPGLIRADLGEGVGRGSISRAFPTDRSVTISVHLHGITSVERGVLPRMTKELEHAIISGMEAV